MSVTAHNAQPDRSRSETIKAQRQDSPGLGLRAWTGRLTQRRLAQAGQNALGDARHDQQHLPLSIRARQHALHRADSAAAAVASQPFAHSRTASARSSKHVAKRGVLQQHRPDVGPLPG